MAAMLAALASGYHGPPQLTFARAVSSWTLDPWSLTVIIVAGALYLAGVRRIRRVGADWPAGRVISFCGLGLGFAVVATMSSVGVYQPVLFYVRSVQTILLLLVVPLFLALGRPLTLIIGTVPRLGPWLDVGDQEPSRQAGDVPRHHHVRAGAHAVPDLLHAVVRGRLPLRPGRAS